MAVFSERSLIAEIRRLVAADSHSGLLKGIGDDCAVLRKSPGLLELVTTDTLVEAVHFDLAWHPPALLGRKSAAVNLSDIAAMGGMPRYALLSLGLPGDLDKEWLAAFLEGFTATLRESGALLVGGDTVRSEDRLVVSVTVLGEVAETEVVYRSGARPGDLIWVSGPLGAAAAGLELCRRGVAIPAGDPWERLVQAHLDPCALVALGRVLAGSGMVRAMMDLSDGLATDLAHLCVESGVGAEIRAADLPVPAGLRRAAARCGVDFLDWVLRGGEDYQLLFVSSVADGERLAALAAREGGTVIHCVGRITAGSGVGLLREGKLEDITFSGFDHFPA